MAGVIETAWRSYAEVVVPPTASTSQRTECRRSFYAGAAALLDGIVKMLDPGEEPTAADLARMDAIAHELRRFGDDVTAGRA